MNQEAKSSDAEYLDWIKAWTDEDKKVVLLLMGFDLATISLVLSGRAASTGPWKSFGLLLLLTSAGCYYLYFSKLHLALRDLRPGGIPLSSTLVDKHFANVWRIGRPWFEWGSWLMVIGIFVLVLAMWRG